MVNIRPQFIGIDSFYIQLIRIYAIMLKIIPIIYLLTHFLALLQLHS